MFQLLWSDSKKTQLVDNIVEENSSQNEKISNCSFLLWEEHCIECAPVIDESTCLHSRRKDNECASFTNGIEENNLIQGIDDMAYQIEFKRWAKLETQWSFKPKMYSIEKLKKLTSFLNSVQRVSKYLTNKFSFIPYIYLFNKFITSIYNKNFKSLASIINDSKSARPDGFLIEFYVPENINDALILELVIKNKPVFKDSIKFKKGWNRKIIEYSKLYYDTDDLGLFRIWISSDSKTKIVFKNLNLIKLKKKNQHLPSEKIKCVVFDLDNTLWEGVIGDDGENVKVNQDLITFIKELDERGIICSISSKNNYALAWNKIKKLELEDYFLYPQINWKHKSLGIFNISKKLNIGIDSIALIDDSEFERKEVNFNYPEVRTYNPLYINTFLKKPEFDVKITEQSKKRRQSYIENYKRNEELQNSELDLDQFLINCEMKMRFFDTSDKFGRVFELASRTNQFNTSGKKFSFEEFKIHLKNFKSICFEVKDKFGNYGVVGLVTFINKDKTIYIDQFLLSCRVAEKKVEETLVKIFLKDAKIVDKIKFKFNATERNMPIKNKLEEIGFKIENNKNGSVYILNKSEEKPLKNFIEIENENLLISILPS